MPTGDEKQQRPESYPKPTEMDSMLKQQDEFNENLNTHSSSHYPVSDNEAPQTKGAPDKDAGEK